MMLTDKADGNADGADGPPLDPVSGEVVHAIAGRVRLRVPRLKGDAVYASRLTQCLEALPWVNGIQVNPTAACLTLTYDPGQFSSESILPAEILIALQRASGLTIAWETPNPTHQPDLSTTEPLNLSPFDSPSVETHLRTVGGGLIGAVAGDMVGGAVGATAGAIMLGPPGAILGSQIGVFVGGVIGAQIGAETVHHTDLLTRLSGPSDGFTFQKIAATIQKRAGEKIGETAGQAVGGVMGRVVLGPPGQVLGAIVGGAIGSQLGEDTASPPKSALVSPLVQPEQNHALPTPPWLAKTTQKFLTDTAATTVGGAIGRLALGPAGQQVGVKLGNRISRIVEAHSAQDNERSAGNPEKSVG